MSSQGLPTLELDVRSRRAQRVVALSVTALAVAAPCLLGSFALSQALSLALSVVAAVVLPIGFWRAGWIGRQHQIIRIVWQADGRWFLSDTHGRTVEAALRADTRISTRALWLRWDIQFDPPMNRASTLPSAIPQVADVAANVIAKLAANRKSMLLVAGDVPESDLRRLFVRLRIDQSRPAAQLPTMPTP